MPNINICFIIGIEFIFKKEVKLSIIVITREEAEKLSDEEIAQIAAGKTLIIRGNHDDK